MSDQLLIGGTMAIILVIAIVLAIDHFKGPLPYVRRLREVLIAVGGTLIAVLTLGLLRRRKPEPERDEKVTPREFDDAPERAADKVADDTDLDAAKTDRDVADLQRGTAERDAELAELRSRLDKL